MLKIPRLRDCPDPPCRRTVRTNRFASHSETNFRQCHCTFLKSFWCDHKMTSLFTFYLAPWKLVSWTYGELSMPKSNSNFMQDLLVLFVCSGWRFWISRDILTWISSSLKTFGSIQVLDKCWNPTLKPVASRGGGRNVRPPKSEKSL